MTHPQFRLAQRYGLHVTTAEIEALEYMISRNLIPWEVLTRVRGEALLARIYTWGRTLYGVWCPVRGALLTFLTARMARRWLRRKGKR